MKSPLTFVFGFIRECGKKLFENNKKKKETREMCTHNPPDTLVPCSSNPTDKGTLTTL